MVSAYGPAVCDRSAWSDRLQVRPTGWRPRRRAVLQTQLREVRLDVLCPKTRRDDLQLTAKLAVVSDGKWPAV